MVRAPTIDKNGLKRGAWSEDEDNKLRAYIQRYGHWNWIHLPRFAGLSRCGKSCRLRWMNYLRPGLKRGNYSDREEELILKLREEIGNRWSAIAEKLPGRSDNEIKNYWHTHLKKRVKQDPKPSVSMIKTKETSMQMNAADQEEEVTAMSMSESTQKGDLDAKMAISAPPSSEIPSDNYNSTLLGGQEWATEDSINSVESLAGTFESFWTEPFLLDTSNYKISSPTSCNSTLLGGLEWAPEDSLGSVESCAHPIESFWTEPFISHPSYNQFSFTTSCNSPHLGNIDWFKEDSIYSEKPFGYFSIEPSSFDASYNQFLSPTSCNTTNFSGVDWVNEDCTR